MPFNIWPEPAQVSDYVLNSSSRAEHGCERPTSVLYKGLVELQEQVRKSIGRNGFRDGF